MPKKTFYITTPIYYPSGHPHIGTCYTDILADVFARWHRLNGEEVYFCTGTDEHAQKVEKASKELNITPQEYVDEIAEVFKNTFKKYNISYTKFVRTSSQEHKDYCKKILNKVYKKGDIYKGKYSGLYCLSCETFYTEKDLVNNKCPHHGIELQEYEEDCYFFKLSKYEKKIVDYIKKQNYIYPKERQDFILNRIKQEGLKDISISRKNSGWGVPLPFDEKKVAWVWFDALLNYLSGIEKNKKFWPANIHLTAHDILWHHSVVWLGMLFSAEIEPPERLVVHGFILGDNDKKMSKSLGNVIDPIQIIQTYPIDSIRYFLSREIPLGLDGAFSMKALNERHNNELVNDLGNLHARTLSMIEKFYNGKIPKATKNELVKKLDFKKINTLVESYELHNALSEIWKFINECNKFISENKPWELAKTDKKRLDLVMYNLIESLRLISILLYPYLPETSEKIRTSLCIKEEPNFKNLKFGLIKSTQIQKVGYLFTRIDEVEKMKETKIETKTEHKPIKPLIQFSDFEKLDLRVGKIIKAEPHPNADKLCVLQVDFGDHNRQIVAGIRLHYNPEDLINRKIIVVVNLQPASLRGVESQGMLLAAVDNDKVVLLTPEKDISKGSRVS
jgi:methionyl-tRNA synthetase